MAERQGLEAERARVRVRTRTLPVPGAAAADRPGVGAVSETEKVLPEFVFMTTTALSAALTRQSYRCLCGQPLEVGAAVLSIVKLLDGKGTVYAAMHGECQRGGEVVGDGERFAAWVGETFDAEGDYAKVANAVRRTFGFKPRVRPNGTLADE